MRPSGEVLPLVAAGTVAAAVALGGAFAPGERAVVATAIAVLGAWAVFAADRGPAVGERLALAVVGWGVVSAAAATAYPFAAKQVLGGWLIGWTLWFIFARTPPERVRAVGIVVAAGAAAVAAAVAVECVGSGRVRAGGLFVNPNVAAALLVPAIPVVWWLLASRHRRALAVLVVSALALGLLLTGSRAGLLALVAVAGVMLPRGRARATGIAVLIVVVGAAVLWRFADRPDSLAWHRIEIWKALWRLVVEAPLFGVGPGWLEEATGPIRIAHEGGIARWGHVIGSAESTPYGLLVRTGIPGLGLALAAALACWRRGALGRAGGRSAACAAFAGVIVMALFHDYLDVDVVLWWWALLLGVTVSAARPEEDVGADRPLGGSGWRVALGLALGFAVLWSVATPALARWVWWSGHSSPERADRATLVEPLYGEPVEWRTDELLADAEWGWEDAAKAISWSRRAVELHPRSARAWTRLGDVYARVATELGPWPDAVAGAREGFERATLLEPHLPWAWLRWAVLERTLGQLDAAEALADRAVTEEPSFVRGWLLRARLALDRGDRSAARSCADRARAAAVEGRQRELTGYERDLLQAPAWQVRELATELASESGEVTR